MASQLFQLYSFLRGLGTLNLYTGEPTADSEYKATGFNFTAAAPNLLASITVGANNFNISVVEAEKKWRYNLVTGNKVGTCTANGTITYGVLNMGTAYPFNTFVASAGTDEFSVFRLDTIVSVTGQPITLTTFNFNLDRNFIQ